MERTILNSDQLIEAINTLDNWREDDKTLKKSYKFKNFAGALDFVNKVAALAEAADHHPDLKLGWGYADIALTTHDRGGITDIDISLAARIDQIS